MDIRQQAIDNYLSAKYDLAIDLYLQLINFSGDVIPQDYYNLGVCYLKIGDYNKGIEYFNMCLYIDFSTSNVFYNLALSYVMVEKYNKALLCIKTSLKINKNDKDGQILLKKINKRLNKDKEKNTMISTKEISQIVKKKIVYVVYFKINYGFDVYSFVYDNNGSVSENLVKHVTCKRMYTKKYEECKEKLLKKYNTEKFIIIEGENNDILEKAKD